MSFNLTEKSEIFWLILITVLMISGLFIHLDTQPVFLEEPRRAIVAMEMIEKGNYITPTFLGFPYLHKPPLFNWVIVLMYQVTDNYELALRLPTVLSTIGIFLLLFLMGRKYVSNRFGWYLALCFLASNGILFYFSLLGEIDLLYALLTLLGFFSVYHFFHEKKFFRLFLFAYFFGALAFLTKGFPSVLFLALSIPLPFIMNRRIKQLFSLEHATGIGLFILLTGGYYVLYNQQMDAQKVLAGIWSQASQRTVVEQSALQFIRHLFLFPLETLANLFPGILLAGFLLNRSGRQILRENEFIRFSLLVLAINILVYWISPGTRQRYIYMLYPFILMPGIFAFLEKKIEKTWVDVFGQTAGILLAILLLLAGLVLPTFPETERIASFPIISYGTSFIMAGVLILHFTKPKLYFAWILLTFALSRIVFDVSVLPYRAIDSSAQKERDFARDIAVLSANNPLFVYKTNDISLTTIYYLNRYRDECIQRNDILESGSFYLIYPEDYPGDPKNKLIREFPWKNKSFWLIKQ